MSENKQRMKYKIAERNMRNHTRFNKDGDERERESCHFFPNWCRCFWPFPFRLFAGNFKTDTLAFFSVPASVPSAQNSHPTSQWVKAKMEMIIEENAKHTTTHTNNNWKIKCQRTRRKMWINVKWKRREKRSREKYWVRNQNRKSLKITPNLPFCFCFYLFCVVCALAREKGMRLKSL